MSGVPKVKSVSVEASKSTDLNNAPKKTNEALVAEASINKTVESSKAAKVWSFTKETTSKVFSAVAYIFGYYAVKDFFANRRLKALESTKLLEKNKEAEGYKSTAVELKKRIKNFDNLNPSSNQYLTAKQKYEEAVNKVMDDLSNLKHVSRDEYIDILTKGQKNYRINVDAERYGFKMKYDTKNGVSYKSFIETIIKRESVSVNNEYNKMINEYADKYSKILNDKDPKKADSLENDIISTISKLASDNKIKNILGKNDQAIRDDLFNASIKKLAGYFSSGKSNAFKLLNLEKSKLTDPVSFANAMRAQRKEVESKHSKALKDLQAAVDEKTKRLKLLMAQKELLRKKQQSLLDQLEKPEICKPEKEYVQKEAERINKAIENIENEIKLYDKQIEKLKESKDKQIADQENAYINVVNAKIDILAKLLNQENKSLSRPRDPNFKDKLYGRMKKAAVIAATVGLTGVAAACGYDKYYYDGKYAGSSVDYLKNAYSNYSNIFSSKEDSDMCPAVPFNSIYYNSTL